MEQQGYLEPLRGKEHEVANHVLPELIGDVEAERPVLVVDGPLLLVAQDAVGVIDLLELEETRVRSDASTQLESKHLLIFLSIIFKTLLGHFFFKSHVIIITC